MSFPRRSMVSSRPQFPERPINKVSEEDSNFFKGFPDRHYVDESAKEASSEKPKPTSEVVIDTGYVKEDDPSVKTEQETVPTPFQDNKSIKLDADGMYYETPEIPVSDGTYIPQKATKMVIDVNTDLSVIEEFAKPITIERQVMFKNKVIDTDPHIIELRETPLDDLIFHVFTEEEIEALPIRILENVLRRRHRVFKQKFGSDGFAWENIIDYGDKRPQLKEKLIRSNRTDSDKQ